MTPVELLQIAPADTAPIIEDERIRLAAITRVALAETTDRFLGFDMHDTPKIALGQAMVIHALGYAEVRDRKPPVVRRGADVLNAALTMSKVRHGIDPDLGRKITAERFAVLQRVALSRLVTTKAFDQQIFVSSWRFSYLSEALQSGAVRLSTQR